MTDRKRRHFGSVRKRVSKRHGDNWEAAYWHEGQRIVADHHFATKEEANAWLDAKNTEIRAGRWIDPAGRKLKFSEWAELWKTTTVDLRPSTRERDLGYLNRYVLPTFGHQSIGKIDYMAVSKWVAEMLDPGPKPWWDVDNEPDRPRRPLSASTVTKAGQVMGKIMAMAVRAGKISSNPCEGIKLPRIERREMRFLNTAEVDQLARAIDPAFRAVVYLGAFGGLRAGELFGLRRDRVDVLRRRVDICETVVEVAGLLYVGPPKTRAGHRIVPLPQIAVDALVEHIRTHPGDPSDYVFSAPHGGPVRLASWRSRFWNPAVKASGLAHLRSHDLRHTAVALWIAAGASPKEASVRAGHTSVSFTLDRYGHLYPGSEDEVNDRLDAMVAEGRKPAKPLQLVSNPDDSGNDAELDRAQVAPSSQLPVPTEAVVVPLIRGGVSGRWGARTLDLSRVNPIHACLCDDTRRRKTA